MDNIRNKSNEDLLLELEKAKNAYDALQVRYQKEINEKQKIESKLSSHQGLSDLLFQDHESVMLLIDPLSGKIIDANKSAALFYNYPVEQLREMLIDDIKVLTKDDIEIEKIKVVRKVQNQFIFLHRISNGEIRQVEVYSSPVEFNGQKLLFSIIHDITGRDAVESKLTKNEDALRKAEEIGKFGYWNLFLDEKLIKASEGATIIYGFSQVEIPLEEVQAVVLAEYRPMLDKALNDLIFNGNRYDVEYKIRRKSDGIIVDIHSLAEFDASKNIVFGTIQDISERKQIEEAMTESEEKFHSLFVNMIEGAALHEIIYNQDGEAIDYVIIETNPAFESQLDFSRESVIGKTSREAYGVADPPFLDIYSKVALTGEPVVFETYYPPLARHFSISVYSPYKGSFATIFIDITDRKKAEQTIRESERRYHGLLDHLDAGIVVHAADSSIIMANPKAQELLGLSEEQLTGALGIDPQWKFLLDDLSPMPLEDYPVNKILNSKNPVKDFLIGVYRPITNDVVWLLVNGFPTLGENGVISEVLISFTDITERKTIEDNLLESQRLLHEAQRLAQIGVWNWDNTTNAVTWSEELCKIVGRDPNLPVPAFKDQQFVFTPESYKLFAAAIESVNKTGRKIEIELEVVHADRSLRNVIGYVGLKYDSKGRIKGLYGTLQDITERKMAEQALLNSEQKLETMLQTMVDGMVTVNMDGEITYCNPAAEHILAMSKNVLGKYFQSNEWNQIDEQGNPFPPDQLPLAIALREQRTVTNIEHAFISSQGEIKWISVNAAPLLDNKGMLFGGIASFRDTTERKKAEAELLETNAYLENLINYANAPIIVWDPQFSITRFNHAFESLTGRLEADVLGKSLDILFPPELSENSMELIRKTLSGERWETVEIKILNIDGSVRTVLWNSATLLGQDGKTPVATIAMGQDITERKQAEELLQKSQFNLNNAQHMSHIGSWEWDMIANTINFSDELFLIFGLSSETSTINADLLLEFIHPDDKAFYLSNLENSSSAGESVPFEYRIVRRDGEVRNLFASGHVIFDENHKPVKGVGVIQDVTDRKQAEEALRETNAYLENLINYANAPIIVWDPQFSITRFNHAFESLTGRLEADVLGKSLDILFPPELSENSMKLIRKTVSGERWETVEIKILNIDGSVRTVLWNSATLLGLDGKTPVATIAQGQDITERKQAEDAVHKSRELLNRTQKIANLGSWELDIESGQLIWSDEVYQIFGFSPQEFPATYSSFLESIHPDDRDNVNSAYSESINNNKDSYEIEHRIVRNTTGETRIVFEKCEHIRNASGKIVSSVGSILDITERKNAEVALRESKNQLNLMLQTTDQGIYGIGPDGCCTFINLSGLSLLGYTTEECIGRNMHLLIHHSHPDGSTYEVNECPIFKAKSTGKGTHINSEVFWRKDGTFFASEYSSYPTFENGEISGAVITFADITERKRVEEEINSKNEELLRLVTEKDKLFSIIAHDLRSPFNAFLGFTRMMVEDLPKLRLDEIQTMALSMRTSATNLYRLLENLLEWSRIQRGMTGFEPIPLLLLPKIAASLQSVIESADKKEIETVFTIPDDLVVFADENMLTSAIRNLMSNSVKFTKKGGKITVHATEKDNNTVEISVGDTGIGMNNTMLGKLFDPTSNSSRKGTEGELSTGLGLIICKDFVEKNGGKIWAESEEGKGSTFYFTVPGNAGQAVKTASKDVLDEGNNTPARKLKIVIADDDETSQMLIAMAVKPISMEIIKVQTGADAVEACRNHPDIDLVMMDIKMPGMDGYEATRQIRQFNKSVVIIAQTAFGLGSDRENALKSGCNDYLSKPIVLEALKELIQKHFKM